MAPRFEHLLVPVDFSEETASALETVGEMAAQNRARLTLLHVIETIEAGQPSDEDLDEFYEELASKAREKMGELAQPFRDRGLTVQQEIVYGGRIREIIQFSMREDVDLVVMRARRLDPQQPEESWGGLSHRISVLAQCPVLLLK